MPISRARAACESQSPQRRSSSRIFNDYNMYSKSQLPIVVDLRLKLSMTKTRGERLKSARAKFFKSGRSAAAALGVPAATYGAHERAESPGGRDYGPKEAQQYGRRFGVSPEWLLTGAGNGDHLRANIGFARKIAPNSNSSVELLTRLSTISADLLTKTNRLEDFLAEIRDQSHFTAVMKKGQKGLGRDIDALIVQIEEGWSEIADIYKQMQTLAAQHVDRKPK